MKNHIQDGHTIAIANTGTEPILSGSPVAIGDMVAVAITDIKPGFTGDGCARGVMELPKLAADNIAQGKSVYLKDGKIQLTATDAIPAGKAWEAAGASSTTVLVGINV